MNRKDKAPKSTNIIFRLPDRTESLLQIFGQAEIEEKREADSEIESLSEKEEDERKRLPPPIFTCLSDSIHRSVVGEKMIAIQMSQGIPTHTYTISSDRVTQCVGNKMTYFVFFS